MYPQIFYKPLFACAASTKEFAVVNFLAIIASISKFQTDFWFRSAEMISVALMSDGGSSGKGKGVDRGQPQWGTARLGQSVLLVELISRIQNVRRLREENKVRHFVALLWSDLTLRPQSVQKRRTSRL
jgi:hypothetical protein